MPRHDGADAGGNGGAEGSEFDRVQPGAPHGDHRQTEVAVSGGITVAGKMLGGAESAVFFAAAHEGGHHRGHLLGVFAEGADVDDGVLGIVVDVGHRRQHPVHAQCAGFDGGGATQGFGILGIAGSADGHVVREDGGGVDAEAGAALEVARHQQGRARQLLQAIGQAGQSIDSRQLDPAGFAGPGGDHETAHVQLPDLPR